MQINRLFEIVYILLEKRKITAKELADKFEVSTRTIYRDIEILSAAKIPVYANKGKGGGISLLDDYVLNKSLLSEEEQNQILFALQSIEKISNQEGKNILEKMGVIFNKSKTNYRLFKISRMKKIRILPENFKRELPEIVEKKQDFKTIQVELEISKDMSYRVYDEFKKENIFKKENGDFIIKVEFPENDWIYGYILSFGEQTKVLSPEYVKDIIQKNYKKV